MKNKKVSCYRCGKEYPLTYKNIAQVIECAHCHGKMVLDDQSQRKVKYVRYFFVAIIVVALMLLVKKFMSMENVLYLFIVVSIAIVIALVADKLCLYLASVIFKLNYVEYVKKTPVKAKKK